MAAPATNTSGTEYEVFLSFHGPDTRDTFTSCLYCGMVEKGIRVFKDDKELQVGQKIRGSLLRALDESQIYIPIFSKGFASSPWCLLEVAQMVDCTSKSDGKKQILPIFLDVQPDDVKLKKGPYRDALSEHLEKYGPVEVKRWEDALVEVPTTVGWKLEGQGYGELIRSIVREVQLKLKVKHQSLPDHLVKVDDQEAIEDLLDIGSDGVRFVIIHGTGGIGKSTLTKEKPAVRALSLGISHDFTPQELARLPSLRFLGGEGMNFTGNFKNLLPNLRWLSWRYCSLNLRAKNLHLVNLVMLDLSESKISHKWSGWRQIKMATKLKVLNLTWCTRLTKTPDFSEFGKLEKLILYRCMNLSTMDSSIGKMKRLSTLDLKGCDSLQRLPEEIGSLECLSEISLTSGHQQIELPKTLGNLKSLTKFEMISSGAISQLPHSIGRLTSLTHLILRESKTIHELPDSLGELKSLVELDIRRSYISVLPDSIGNLKRLKVVRMGNSKIQTIPCALGQVETLEVLDVSCCRHIMDEIPWQMWSLPHLRTLDLRGTTISTLPQKISGFSNLQTLHISSVRRWLCPLPELPSSLKFLEAKVDTFNVLPDLSSLVHLDHLHLYGPIIPSWSEDDVISSREEMLFIHRLPRSLPTLILWEFPQLPDFSDLRCLSVLTIRNCPMPHFPTLKFLERIMKLEIISCHFLESTPDLSPLKRLEELHLRDLPKLAEIPGLGELESLKFLHIWGCYVIEQLPNLSKLKNLQLLKLFNCDKIEAVEGLEKLNSLKNADIQRCMSLKRLPDLPAFTKLTTGWMTQKAAKHTFVPRKRLRRL